MKGKRTEDEFTDLQISPQMKYYFRHKKEINKRRLTKYHQTKSSPHKKQKKQEYSRKTKYGISSEDYKQLLKEQENCCAICRRHQSSFKKGLYIDHDHTTGKVRGLLCCTCNTFLGGISDNVECLNIAKEYVLRNIHC